MGKRDRIVAIYDDLRQLYELVDTIRRETAKVCNDKGHPLQVASDRLTKEFYPIAANIREELGELRQKRESSVPITAEVKERATVRMPPTLEEVTEYCKSRNSVVDPVAFFDHYEMKGWKVGRTKMANWRAGVRIWESRTARWEES